MASLTLDFATDDVDGIVAQVETFVADAGATVDAVTLVTKAGPGGGWPVVRLYGDQAQLDKVEAFYDGEA